MSVRNAEKKVVFSVKIPGHLNERIRRLKEKTKLHDEIEWSISDDVIKAIEKIVSCDEKEVEQILKNSSCDENNVV